LVWTPSPDAASGDGVQTNQGVDVLAAGEPYIRWGRHDGNAGRFKSG